MRRIGLLIIIVGCVLGCDSSQNPITPRAGEQFRLRYGQTAVLQGSGLILRFTNVRADSRCPVGAMCVWAGNAEIVLQVSRSDYSLNTTLEPKEVAHLNYTIALLGVDPHRRLNEEIRLEDYIATLLVTQE
jgi:hypothetical protein